MANNEESSPLLANQPEVTDEKKPMKPGPTAAAPPPAAKKSPPLFIVHPQHGWTADGLPMAVGDPVRRGQWDSSIFGCLGSCDQFCSSDLEVCLLGCVAPCMLHASTAERIGSGRGTFANHCLTFSGLHLIDKLVLGVNCLTPWFTYSNRTAIRKRFNLEGSCEALSRSCGCCGSLIEDELQRECCESACDLATHCFCLACALCQEGREVRHRLPQPGFNALPVLVMLPPGEQKMGRCGPEYSASA